MVDFLFPNYHHLHIALDVGIAFLSGLAVLHLIKMDGDVRIAFNNWLHLALTVTFVLAVSHVLAALEFFPPASRIGSWLFSLAAISCAVLWAALGMVALRSRAAHPLMRTVAWLSAICSLASISMLWSPALVDGRAIAEHLVVVVGLLVLLVATMRTKSNFALLNRELEQDLEDKSAELYDSEAKFKQIAQNMSEGLMIFDSQGNVTYHNRESARIHGVERSGEGLFNREALPFEWSGRTKDGLPLSLEDWPIARVLRGERFHGQYVHAERSDSSVAFDAVYNGSPVYAANGDFVLGFITLRDVGNEIQAQNALENAHDMLRGVTDAVPAAIFAKDREGRMLLVNRLTAEVTGKEPDALLGKTDEEIFDDTAQATVFMANDQRIMDTGLTEQIEEQITLLDGTQTTWLSIKSPIRDNEGAVTGLIGVAMDITARKAAEAAMLAITQRLEKQSAELLDANSMLKDSLDQSDRTSKELHSAQQELLHTSRRTAMGDMAAAIAHEINQPLTATAMYVDGSIAILEKDGYQGPLIGSLAQARDQCQRAGDIIRRVRSFVSGASKAKQAEDLCSVIDDACSLALVGSREKGVAYAIEHNHPGILVFVDRVQIGQVIVNLIRNAIDALSGVTDGALRVTTGCSEGNATVSISDNGPGIHHDIRGHLFDPFTSTKGEQGLGVGLSICRTIVEKHGGKIWVDSGEGRGTTFCFVLPLLSEGGEA